MKNKTSLFLIAIVMAAVLIFILFWYSQPVRQEAPVNNQLETITSQIEGRSTYTQLPITFSSDQVGKVNPFK